LRAQYQAHFGDLKLVGAADAESKAAVFCRLKFGWRSFPPDADAADVFKQNNPWKQAEFGTKAPGMDWNSYFTSAG
jgi:hypothetical protein